jgi:hypothetical protein
MRIIWQGPGIKNLKSFSRYETNKNMIEKAGPQLYRVD